MQVLQEWALNYKSLDLKDMDLEKLEGYVNSRFLEVKNSGSKVIWQSKGEKIVAVLKRKDGDGIDAHFRSWVKLRTFFAL